MKNSIMSQLVRLEEHFVQFEKMGGKLTDEMKSAVVLKCVSAPLKIRLNLSLNESSTYAQIREVIKAYDTATTKWTGSVSSSPYSPQTAADATGLAPMEIDRVKGGKAAGKGKGKSKEGKGKAKGKEQKGKGKTCGKQNQWNSTSTTSWSTTSKSGKGGDQNDKGKGKSKSKDGVTCFKCGRVGRMAKDCWRVRQVGNPEASSTVLSSVTGQESVGPSVSQAATAVKRVAFSAGEHDPVVFDMRSSSISSWCHCRMVKFFYIDNEEYKPMSIRSTTFGGETNERYEIDTNEVDIIIDSGADAPVFPSSMIHCGRQCDGQQVALQDAQGRALPLLGQRSVAVVLEDKNGVEIEVRDNVVFSDEISQPILSFGRLMNAGWSMCAQTRSLRNGAYEIPLDFQNSSLIVRGHVRTIGGQPQAIRALKADLTPGLQAYVDNAFGWHRDGTRWVGSSPERQVPGSPLHLWH